MFLSQKVARSDTVILKTPRYHQHQGAAAIPWTRTAIISLASISCMAGTGSFMTMYFSTSRDRAAADAGPYSYGECPKTWSLNGTRLRAATGAYATAIQAAAMLLAGSSGTTSSTPGQARPWEYANLQKFKHSTTPDIALSQPILWRSATTSPAAEMSLKTTLFSGTCTVMAARWSTLRGT